MDVESLSDGISEEMLEDDLPPARNGALKPEDDRPTVGNFNEWWTSS
jgi:hypothetical protein